MTTPRQKAIIVGCLMGGSEIIGTPNGKLRLSYDVPNILDGGNREYFQLWLMSELAGYEDQEFLSKMAAKFYDANGYRIMPMDYVEKMSPLAMVVWYSHNYNKLGGLHLHDWQKRYERDIRQIIYDRWGVRLTWDRGLHPTTGDDLVTLWCSLRSVIINVNPALTPSAHATVNRKNKQIYLSGGMQFADSQGAQWRAKLTPELFRRGYDVYNPVCEESVISDVWGVNYDQLREEDFDGYVKVGSLFIEKDRQAVLASDVVITYWDESAERGSGTKAEITWTHDFNITNLLVLGPGYTRDKLPIWTLGGIRDASHIFSSFEDMLEALDALH